MPHPLFLQAAPTSAWEEIPHFLETFWPVLLPTAVGLAAVYLLLPRALRYPPLWGGSLAGLALALAGWLLIRTDTALPETVLFYSFAGLAIRSSPTTTVTNASVRTAAGVSVEPSRWFTARRVRPTLTSPTTACPSEKTAVKISTKKAKRASKCIGSAPRYASGRPGSKLPVS